MYTITNITIKNQNKTPFFCHAYSHINSQTQNNYCNKINSIVNFIYNIY